MFHHRPAALIPILEQTHRIATHQCRNTHAHTLLPTPTLATQSERIYHLIPLFLQPELRLAELSKNLPNGKPCYFTCYIYFHNLVFL